MIPTAYDGKKLVVLSAVYGILCRYTASYSGRAEKSALLFPSEWFSTLSQTKKAHFTAAVNALVVDISVNDALNGALRSIVAEFIADHEESKRIPELVKQTEERWKRLSFAPFDVAEFNQHLALLRANTGEETTTRMWQAIAAYICRDEQPNAPRMTYLFTPGTIAALAHRLSVEFPVRFASYLDHLIRAERQLPVGQHINRLIQALRPEKTPLAVGAMPSFPAFSGKITSTSLSLLLTFASQYETMIASI